ncbi:MAG: zinc ribbon domain-containing protein [Firmicutes bacterium]|nr:zinc ribbon domain-containing protein [Bacillota bacterium]
MFCTKCGSQNNEGSMYCNKCGEALPVNNAPYVNTPQQVPPQWTPTAMRQKKASIALIIGIVAGVVVAGVIVAVVLVKNNGGEKSSSVGSEARYSLDDAIDSSKKQVAESNARSVYSSASGFQAANDYKLTGIIDDTTRDLNDTSKTFGDFIGSGMTGEYRAIIDDADGMIKQADWTDGNYTGSYKVEDGRAYIASAKGDKLGRGMDYRLVGETYTSNDYDDDDYDSDYDYDDYDYDDYSLFEDFGNEGYIEKSKKQVAESNARTVYTAASGFQAATDYKLMDTIITASTECPGEYTFTDFIGSEMTGEYRAIVGDDGMITQADWTDGNYTATYKVEDGKAYIASAKGGELGGATDFREQ